MNSQTPLPPPAPLCIPDFGFCGAPVVELEMLPTMAGPGEVIFFGVDREFSRKFGIHNPGAATFIRERTAVMMPWAEVSPIKGYDIGIITAAEVNTAVRETRALSCHLARQGWRPALIGCDHTASLINLLGAIEGSGTVPIYLTFDAHYDIGRHNPQAGTHNSNFVDVLLASDKVSRVINVGGRSWSTFVSIYDMVPRFTSIPGGPQRMSAAEVIERLYWLQDRPLYVSIDADVLDPSGAPNACSPEPFGLSADDLHTICHWIGSCCRVIGADLCELVPSDASACSEQVLMSCLQALFGEAREK
ncbi:MAG: arginase family protein [Rhodospirillaceae bacterium]